MKFLFIPFFALLFVGCKSGAVSPSSFGTQKIFGDVYLFDDLNNNELREGMMVEIKGNGFTALTDSAGRYSFSNVPFGTYSITYSKEGYGTYQLDTFYHKQNVDDTPTIIPRFALGRISTTSITGLDISIVGDTVKVNPFISPAGDYSNPRGVRLFYGTSDAVAGNNYDAHSDVYRIRNSTGVIKIGKTELYAMGFTSGTTVFVKAYGEAFTANDYTDVATGKRVFPNLNTTTVAAKSFVLP